jgi:hypothetical protein
MFEIRIKTPRFGDAFIPYTWAKVRAKESTWPQKKCLSNFASQVFRIDFTVPEMFCNILFQEIETEKVKNLNDSKCDILLTEFYTIVKILSVSLETVC